MKILFLAIPHPFSLTPRLLMSIQRSPSDSEVEALDDATSQSLRHRLSQHWRTFRRLFTIRETDKRASESRESDGERYLLSGSVAPRGQHAHVHV